MTATAASTVIVFECIEGKDDHLAVSLAPGQRVTLGSPDTDGIAVKELENTGDRIVLRYENSLLQIETLGGKVPVKVNTSSVTTGTIKPGDMVWIGQSLWRANYPGITAAGNHSFDTTAIRHHFNNLIGLEDLKDFRLRDIFSKVFKNTPLRKWKINW